MNHIDINTASLKKYDPFSIKTIEQSGGVFVSFSFHHLKMYFVDYFVENNIEWSIDKTFDSDDNVLIPVELYKDSTLDCPFNGERVEWFLINRDGKVTTISNKTLHYYQISQFNIEWWYDYLPDGVTPKTWLVPITMREIQSILHSRTTSGEFKKNLIAKLNKKMFEACDCLNSNFTDDNFKSDKFNNGESKFFIKLNSVSPKDACMENTEAMVFGAGEAHKILKLFVQSTRVINTLSDVDETRWATYITIREYLPYIDPSKEFRCFIHRGVMTAISQYDCYRYNPKFKDPIVQIEIRDTIHKFYKKLYPFIPYEDCIMDVVLIDNEVKSWMNTGVMLIEFNVFGAECPCGSGLYSWDLDYNILYGKITDHDMEGNRVPTIRFTPPDQLDLVTELVDQICSCEDNIDEQ